MPTQTTVYVDIENTLRVPFTTGIQRVAKELLRRVNELDDSNVRFVPVVHCPMCSRWRRLTDSEKLALYTPHTSQNRIVASILSLARRTISHQNHPLSKSIRDTIKTIRHRNAHPELSLSHFEPGSIFLDLDSSWHNEYRRSNLLPLLQRQSVRTAKLHYDIIPVLMPHYVHDQTVPNFLDHLHAHIRQMSLFVCISENTKTDLLQYAKNKYGELEPPTAMLTLGADYSSLSPRVDIQKNLLPGHTTRFLLCVGTIEPRKNHETLIKAFSSILEFHNDLTLILVGRAGWKSQSIIEGIKRHKRFGKNILWLGMVNDKSLAWLYRNAFLTIVPSHYEGFGLPLLEALRYGCVVISSTGGALKEVSSRYVDFFESTRADQLTTLIRMYLDNDNLYLDRKNIIMEFAAPNWSDTVKRLGKIMTAYVSDT